MWWTLLIPVAAAQGAPDRFNAQLLRPSADGRALLWIEESHAAPDGAVTARAFLHYGNGLARYDGEHLLSDVLQLDLLGAWHWRGLRLGAHIPVIALAAGAGQPTAPGLGDVAVDVKATLLDATTAPVGVALLGRLLLPTASVAVPLGAGGTGWELLGAVDRQFGTLTVAGNLGLRGVPRAQVGDLVWNDAVFARVGAGIPLTDTLGGSLELSGQTNWASGTNPAGSAVELLAGGWGRIAEALVVRGGVSAGLSAAPGAPLVRLLAGVSWEPDPVPDADFDGLVDRDDWCPSDPEDPDSFEDWDGCPDPSMAIRIDVRDAAGSAVDATVTLSGPELHTLPPGDPLVTLHPGTYRATATAPGHTPWSGELRIPAEQGHRIEIPVVAERGSLKVWAVDERGAAVAAVMRVSDAEGLATDGTALDVPAGELTVALSAPGFRVHTQTIQMPAGETRELTVVLQAEPQDDATP